MDKFYEIQFGQLKDEVFLESLVPYDKQALKLGLFVPQPSLHTKVSEGHRFYNIIRFQDPFNFAISDGVYKILNDSKVTGWSVYNIEIMGRSEKYFGFQVLGRAGEIKRPLESGFITGYELDFKSWDCSDIFCPLGTMSVFCTEKVRDILLKNKTTNLEFEDIRKVEWYSAK